LILFRHFNFLKENIVIMFKYLSEYKASFYSVLLEQFVFLGVNLLMFSVMVENFSDVVGWKFSEFVLFLALVDYMMVLTGIFAWRNWLKSEIISGDFNLKVLRPLNVFWFNYFYKLAHHAFLYSMLNLFVYGFLLFYFKINLVNVWLGVGLFFLIALFWLCFVEFYRSLDWIGLGLSEIFGRPFFNFNWNFKSFPAPFFKKFNLRFVLLIFPSYFLGALVLPVLRGFEVLNFWFYIWFLICGILILCGLISIIWRYGLKNYGAFG